MGLITESIILVAKFLYGTQIPRGFESSLITLSIYVLHLLISSIILYYSVKLAGGGLDFMTGFPRALFTILIRDLIALPLIFITFSIPFLGIIIAVIIWLGLIKFVFNLNWVKTVLAFLISLILPVVIILFILIPLALILLF